MKCANCKQSNPTKKVISHGKILTGCEACLPTLLQQGDNAAFDRKWQQKEYRRELTQPVDPRAFIKAYPDKAREQYTDDVMRKFS